MRLANMTYCLRTTLRIKFYSFYWATETVVALLLIVPWLVSMIARVLSIWFVYRSQCCILGIAIVQVTGLMCYHADEVMCSHAHLGWSNIKLVFLITPWLVIMITPWLVSMIARVLSSCPVVCLPKASAIALISRLFSWSLPGWWSWSCLCPYYVELDKGGAWSDEEHPFEQRVKRTCYSELVGSLMANNSFQ